MANRLGAFNLGPGFSDSQRLYVQFPYTMSGEVTADKFGVPVGTAKFDGKISDVWVTVGASGRDDDQTLSMEVDLKIDGNSVFTTKPKISYVSGEASAAKNTLASGEGIVQAVMNEYAAFSKGDVFIADFNLTRTTSPDVEMANLVMVVEVEPN